MQSLLLDEGYGLVAAADGQHVIHEGLTKQFDVVLFDRGLPGIDGLDILSMLRAHAVTTPTLVLSALGSPSDRFEGLDQGAEDYLSKPRDIDVLLAR